jgi:hypothetical protein
VTRGFPLQILRRSAVVTTAVAQIVAEIARMGADPARREIVGRQIGSRAEALGGVFPWIADLLADLPVLAGHSIAAGVRSGQLKNGLTSFVTTQRRRDGSVLLRIDPDAILIDTDVRLLGMMANLLRPFTGHLSPELVTTALAVVSEQVRLEASLDDERGVRSSFNPPSELICSIVEHTSDGLREQLPERCSELVANKAGLYDLAQAWTAAVCSAGVILPSLSWRTWCRSGDGRLVVRSVAGASPALDYHRAMVDALSSGADDAADHAIREAVVIELGAREDSPAVAKIAKTLTSFVDPVAGPPSLGPLGLLRMMDEATQSSPRPARLSRGFFLLTRQLAVLRFMADEVGIDGSPLRRPPIEP